MTEVTISIPVTAKFDGCYCETYCRYIGNDWCKLDGITGRDDTPSLGNRGYTKVRTRWCCETFGMGERVDEQKHKCPSCGIPMQSVGQYNGKPIYHRMCPDCLTREWNWIIDEAGTLRHPLEQQPAEQPTMPQHWINLNAPVQEDVELETMDANDAETLRRWTSE